MTFNNSTYVHVGRWVKYAWIGAIAFVVALNIQPYREVIRGLAQGVTFVPLYDLLTKLPIVGPLVQLTPILVPELATLAIYGLIQLLQCLPMLLASPDVVRKRLAAGEQWQHLPVGQADPAWMKDLKTRLNNFPLEWIQGIHNASKLAYAVDVALSGLKYPLFTKGWVWAAQNLKTLSLNDVLWGNIFGFVMMVFALEAAVWLYLKLAEGVDIFNGGSTRKYAPEPVYATQGEGWQAQPQQQPKGKQAQQQQQKGA
jgi:hypothetical protein